MKCFYATRLILFLALLTFLYACGGGEAGRSEQTVSGVQIQGTQIQGTPYFTNSRDTNKFKGHHT